MATKTLTTERIPTRDERKAYGQAARRVYESIRDQIEKEHCGEYMVVHPGNGDYFIDQDEQAALDRMKEKYPNVLFFTIRIGFRAIYHFGGSGLSDGQRPAG